MGRHTLIERLYLRELVTFESVEIEFSSKLVVVTGPSGAGKSVLISALLTSFGYSTKGAAKLCELNIVKPKKLMLEAFDLNDNITIKSIKNDNLRYFIDGQNISRKILLDSFSAHVKYLSVRDKGGFDSDTLIELTDTYLVNENKSAAKLLKEYKKRYKGYKLKESELNKILEDEKKLSELIEFAHYEIEKIEKINPKVNEDEELLKIKQQLSKVDKIKDMIEKSQGIFDHETSIESLYGHLDKDFSYFTDAMNQLRTELDEAENFADTLDGVNIEEVLDRLSALSDFKSKYGSIEETIAYRENKIVELQGYENIEKDKGDLQMFLEMEQGELYTLALKISSERKKAAVSIAESARDHLKSLKLPEIVFLFDQTALSQHGLDSVDILLGESKIETLSGGEFNRLRLAMMVASIDKKSHSRDVLILDEIDANVSGDESIAIATMIAELSSVYQIFAISHQPHLSAKADQHILVAKEGNKSIVKSLNDEGRVQEIARIIAGEAPTEEAIKFAKKIRKGR